MRALIAVIIVVFLGLIGLFLFGQSDMVSGPKANPETLAIEAALADGELLAIANANIAFVRQISETVYGKLDTSMIPALGEEDITSQLLNAPKDIALVDDIVVGIKHQAQDKKASTLIVFSGAFNKKEVLAKLQTGYELDHTGNQWTSITEKVLPDEYGCIDNKKVLAVKTEHLFVSNKLILLSPDKEAGQKFVERYLAKTPGVQPLDDWRKYKQGSVIAFQMTAPRQVATAVSGMTGFMIRGQAKENPEINGIAAKATVNLLSASVSINARLDSDKPEWIKSTTGKSQEKLKSAQNEVGSVSPTLQKIMTAVTASSDDNGVVYDAELDIKMLDGIRDIVGEVFSYVFTGNSQQNEQLEAESLESNPVNYALNKRFTALPDAQESTFVKSPLLMSGPFIVDVEHLKQNEKGLLEMLIKGTVSLPELEISSGSKPVASGTLAINSVLNKQGEELLKNERCDSVNSHFGQPNHKPANSEYFYGKEITIQKTVRFRDGVTASQINKIIGEISFSSPTKVTKINIPFKVGGQVEEHGLKFYISKVGKQEVGYQLSGDIARLLEVRGLNADGKVLSKSWNFGDSDGSKKVQKFKGDIHALEIYVLEEVTELTLPFELTDVFSHKTVSADRDSPIPTSNVNYPKAISIDEWNSYILTSIDSIKPDRNGWYIRKGTPIVGEARWPGVAAFFTHKYDKAWENSPTSHLYVPALGGLGGNWTALSYMLKEPEHEDNQAPQYQSISYPYNTKTGEAYFSKNQMFEGKPYHVINTSFSTDLKAGTKLNRLKGTFYLRLPLMIQNTSIELDSLWEEKEINGLKVKLDRLSRGMFPGYDLKVTGDISQLVGIFGIAPENMKVKPHPANFQKGGYWTVTIPFVEGVDHIEVLLASEQKTIALPFDLNPTYGEQ